MKVDHSNHLYCGKITLPSCLVWENKITRGLDLVPQSKESHSKIHQSHGAFFSFWKVISSLLNFSWPVNVCLFLFLFFLSLTGYNIYVHKMYIPMCKRASLFRTLLYMRIKIRWTLRRKLKREVYIYILVKRQNEIENWNKFLTWTSLFMARRNKYTLYLHKYSFHKIRIMHILKCLFQVAL